MRILVAHNVPSARNGGMSRMMGFIHDQLELSGHRVDYFSAQNVPASLNGRLRRFSFPLLLLRHAMRAARSGRAYDIINVHEPCSAGLAVAKRAAGDPQIVVTCHGVEQRGWEVALEDARLGRSRVPLKTRLLYPSTSLWQSRLGLLHADHIFCLSFEDRDYLSRRLRLPRERITRIYPAADPIYASVARQRDYTSADRLLFFGNWLERKGIRDLVAAFAVLAAAHPQLELLVMGAAHPESFIKASFPASMRDRVRCVRTVTEADIAAHLATASILVMPSLFEGTPQTLLEAMLSGLPVVVTATCGMRDVVHDGRNGLLVPVRSPEAIAAAVARLLGDPGLRAQLGWAAHRDAARHYTWQRVAEPVQRVYEQLLEA